MKFEEALEITEKNLINEEIIGNTAIVYHRGYENKLDHLLKQTYSNNSHIDFHEYNKALYTTTSMAAQLNQVGNLNDMKSTYGDFIIKLAFKGASNCWFCSYDEYKKYNNCTIDNWKEQQFNTLLAKVKPNHDEKSTWFTMNPNRRVNAIELIKAVSEINFNAR